METEARECVDISTPKRYKNAKTFILQEHWAFDQLDSMEILKESLTKSSLLME